LSTFQSKSLSPQLITSLQYGTVLKTLSRVHLKTNLKSAWKWSEQGRNKGGEGGTIPRALSNLGTPLGQGVCELLPKFNKIILQAQLRCWDFDKESSRRKDTGAAISVPLLLNLTLYTFW